MGPSLLPYADRVLDGQLKSLLTNWRAAGLTHDTIAAELREREIPVSRETVRRWLKELGVESPPEPEPEAAAS